ncbi:SAM-dependent methyltransferase [Streptomyces sp. NPDC059650]|uniref:SAM-dependent methyltransferase n=1 Tax=Streptomyces sp. NPDC059650 TaxID=3346896 RepID=UPI00368319FC
MSGNGEPATSQPTHDTPTTRGTSVEKGASAYKGSSTKAILHHYDYLGDFYRLFLGEDLVYSHAMWEAGDTLEAAQRRKLDHHIAAARAEGAQRVLDVGCGYGSLLHRMVECHGVQRAVGLTLSPAEAARVRAQGWPRCEVRVENWFDHRPDGPYDAVIVIEAVEHFAGGTLWRSRRVARYREFFRRCHDWLRPAGRLSVQANAWSRYGWLASVLLSPERLAADGAPGRSRPTGRDAAAAVRNLRSGLHASRTVFPECFVPTRSELADASAGLFRIVSERRDPEDGIRTLRAWIELAEENQEDGARLIGRRAVDDIQRELRTSLRFLQEGRATTLRLVFEKL